MSHIGNKLMGLVCSLEFVLVPNGVFRYTDLFATYSSDSVQSLLSFIFLCGRGGGGAQVSWQTCQATAAAIGSLLPCGF